MLVGNNSEMYIPNSMNTLASLILHDHREPLASGSFGETLLAFTEPSEGLLHLPETSRRDRNGQHACRHHNGSLVRRIE